MFQMGWNHQLVYIFSIEMLPLLQLSWSFHDNPPDSVEDVATKVLEQLVGELLGGKGHFELQRWIVHSLKMMGAELVKDTSFCLV